MSVEKYFPDVDFIPLPDPVNPEPEYIGLDEQPVLEDENVSFKEAIVGFRKTISGLNSKLGVKLPLEKRWVSFMPQNALKATLDPNMHAVNYGSYILQEIGGTCTRNKNGTILLRVVHQGKGHIACSRDTMSIFGHEYGHSLGPEIPHPLLEEMKALTFESYFMMEYLTSEKYILGGFYPYKLHDVAKNNVTQLLNRGFPHEAILATLTGQPFGKHKPDSNIEIPVTRSL